LHTRSGRYEAAIRHYDAYLARYPQSVVARIERVETQRLMEESSSKTEITRVARKPRPNKEKEIAEETPPEKKPSRWDRFKRWFRGK
jgi:hypothetical protein